MASEPVLSSDVGKRTSRVSIEVMVTILLVGNLFNVLQTRDSKFVREVVYYSSVPNSLGKVERCVENICMLGSYPRQCRSPA